LGMSGRRAMHGYTTALGATAPAGVQRATATSVAAQSSRQLCSRSFGHVWS